MDLHIGLLSVLTLSTMQWNSLERTVGTIARFEEGLEKYKTVHNTYPPQGGSKTWVYLLLWEAGDPHVPYLDALQRELGSDLDPGLLTQPTDVFAMDGHGLPLVFREIGGKALLYSFGENEIDDNARAALSQ